MTCECLKGQFSIALHAHNHFSDTRRKNPPRSRCRKYFPRRQRTRRRKLRRFGFSSPQRGGGKISISRAFSMRRYRNRGRILGRAISAPRVLFLARERESITEICLFRRYADREIRARTHRIIINSDTGFPPGKRSLHLNRSVLSTSYAAGKCPRPFTAHHCPIRVVCRRKKRRNKKKKLPHRTTSFTHGSSCKFSQSGQPASQPAIRRTRCGGIKARKYIR